MVHVLLCISEGDAGQSTLCLIYLSLSWLCLCFLVLSPFSLPTRASIPTGIPDPLLPSPPIAQDCSFLSYPFSLSTHGGKWAGRLHLSWDVRLLASFGMEMGMDGGSSYLAMNLVIVFSTLCFAFLLASVVVVVGFGLCILALCLAFRCCVCFGIVVRAMLGLGER